VHLGLHSIVRMKIKKIANNDCRPLSWPDIRKRAYPRGAVPSPVHANPVPFPEIWKPGGIWAPLTSDASADKPGAAGQLDRPGPVPHAPGAPLPSATSRYLEPAADSLTSGCAGPHPQVTGPAYQQNGSVKRISKRGRETDQRTDVRRTSQGQVMDGGR
jgi:hypothetical protein